MIRPKGLGRGLDALLAGTDEESAADVLQSLPIDRMQPGKYQPRTQMDDTALEELAASIQEHGVMQPVLVRPIEGGRFEIVAGERRWRAAKRAGLTEVPALVKAVPDQSALALALIENIQREDLNALEQAHGFQQLSEQYGLTQEDIAKRVGKSRAAVANTLRLLHLPKDIQNSLRSGQISAGHARAILAFEDRDHQMALWKRVVKEGLSVRKAEALAKKMATTAVAPHRTTHRSPHVAQVEDRLRNLMGTQVRLHHKPGKGGSIVIEYYTDEDLERLLELFELIERSW